MYTSTRICIDFYTLRNGNINHVFNFQVKITFLFTFKKTIWNIEKCVKYNKIALLLSEKVFIDKIK